jgi:hypothetical protein
MRNSETDRFATEDKVFAPSGCGRRRSRCDVGLYGRGPDRRRLDLEFDSTYAGVATFSGSSTGPGGTLKFDAGSTGPITVVNSNDAVIAQPGQHQLDQRGGQSSSTDTVYAAANFTLPTNVDTLSLERSSATHGTGNNDAVDTLSKAVHRNTG